MFMKRASETSGSTFVQRYRSLLCIATVATFAMCISPKASAQTYNPSSYACLSGGEYQAPQGISDTTGDFDADSYSGVAKVDCTWSFSGTDVVTTKVMTLHVPASYGFAINEKVVSQQCGAGSALVTSNAGGGGYWHAVCKGSGGLSVSIPTGTNLSSIIVTGETQTISVPVGEEYEDFLSISNIYIQ
jgi:hypothetical protein